MKKYLILTAFALLGAQLLPAQGPVQIDTIFVVEQKPVKNIVKLSPFHFIEGTFLLGYERMFNRSSLFINAGIHSTERYFDGQPQFGFQEEIQYRYYVAPPSNVATGNRNFFYFKGFYAGPFVYHRYRQQTVQVWDWVAQENVAVDENINEVAGGVVMGVQVAFANVVFLDFYTGGGVKRSTGRSPQNTFTNVTTPGYNGVIPKVGFMLGVAF